MALVVPDLRGPYNKCAKCGHESLIYKYCPFCGIEFEHVGPERRCPACTNVVWFKGQKYCGLCGAVLTDIQVL
jgi:DNA-directed RNA polymerase subunit RPC12/RpoP